MRKLLFAAASAAVLSVAGFGVASAAPATSPTDNSIVPQGVIGGDYSYVGLNQGLGNANVYGGELGGITPLTSDISAQVIGAYHRIDSSGAGANDWNVAGTVSWDVRAGRIGANVGYTNAGLQGASANVTNYGVYGEYYAGDEFTLGARGGGVTGSASGFGFGTGDKTGGYVGGEAIGYFMPDFAARATVGYVGIDTGHQWTAGARGEYLFSETTPLSGWIGYDYSDIGSNRFSVSANTFSVGVKYYFGGSGSLEHHQRTGEDDWGPATLDFTH